MLAQRILLIDFLFLHYLADRFLRIFRTKTHENNNYDYPYKVLKVLINLGKKCLLKIRCLVCGSLADNIQKLSTVSTLLKECTAVILAIQADLNSLLAGHIVNLYVSVELWQMATGDCFCYQYTVAQLTTVKAHLKGTFIGGYKIKHFGQCK